VLARGRLLWRRGRCFGRRGGRLRTFVRLCRLEGTNVTAYTLHPGTVATNVWRRVPGPISWAMKKLMLSEEEGVQSSIRCATAPELANESGRYYDRHGKERRPSKLASDEALAKELWTKSAEWTGLPA
jgi:hypothetical protein